MSITLLVVVRTSIAELERLMKSFQFLIWHFESALEIQHTRRLFTLRNFDKKCITEKFRRCKPISYHFVFRPFVWDSKARDEGSTVTVVSEERLDGTDVTHTRAVSSLSTLYLGWPSHLYSKTESRNGEAGTGVEFVCRANVCRRHRRTLVPSSLWSLVQVCPDHWRRVQGGGDGVGI